ncbi:CBS domain-containing protein [Rhizobium sp. SEMIA 4085]|uniref:CBS/BON domain-containing protein n=1 Tax=Rhizobium gallicum bv. gallicum R602sp TaxID=1041138 RepID=A0A0B4XHQ7_9HYPH|nr:MULTISPECIES: CBS domain-containing protein [Rhizobium]AJD46133.1 CBS/BON domain-containing protein [Rhizobium gallicum bv. gallicum R602sp]NNH29166.1 CBS domain-containing protein [Rhizobium sp. SEMIA 4085]
MQAKDIMTRTVTSLSVTASIRKAIEIMIAAGVSGLPVVGDDGSLRGIITEGDMLRRKELDLRAAADAGTVDALRDYVHSNSWRVEDVMTTDVVAVRPSASLGEIAGLMALHSIKRVPVVVGDRVIGIVSRRDLLKAVVAGLPDRIPRGEEALRLAVATRLKSDLNLSPEQIAVAVEDGNVILTGTVETELHRKAIKVLAESLRGSATIVDNVTTIADRP